MSERIPNVSRHEGLTIRALDHGGYLVTHPDIYTVKALYSASTTIEEAFAFVKRTFEELDPSSKLGDA